MTVLWLGLAAAVALVCMGAVSAALDPPAPTSYIRDVSEKFDLYRRADRPFDMVFVGNSRVYRGFDPLVVDKTLSQRGCAPAHAFNFGIPGMKTSLLVKIVDFLVAESREPTVIVMQMDTTPYDEDTYRRSRFSNQWSTLLPSFLHILARPGGRRHPPLQRAALVAGIFARTGLGTGLLHARLVERNTEKRSPPSAFRRKHAGYLSLEAELRETRRRGDRARNREVRNRRERFRRNKTMRRFENNMKLVESAAREKSRPATAGEIRFAEWLVHRASSARTRPALLYPPTRNLGEIRRQRAMAAHMRRAHGDVPVLTADPASTPRLYRAALWFDRGHLNRKGAVALSRYAAGMLCRPE